jgi:enterochelin esterase-like enzyme
MNLKYLVLLFSILVAAVSCEKTVDPEPEEYTDTSPAGTVIADDLINSESLGGPQHYAIYLPPGYDTSSIEFPVLYLLHGMWGSYKDWPSHGMAGIVNDLIARESAKPMVIAMPDGLDAFYCNNYNGGDILYEDYFIEEFIPYVESTYRIRASKQNRAIAGLSMGGYGTTFHAFKRPELFCCAYSMSGALSMGESAPDLKVLITSLTSEQLESLPAYIMECGTEDFLVYQSNVDFDAFLTEQGVAHTYITRPGSHDWPFWMECLPKALTKASSFFD